MARLRTATESFLDWARDEQSGLMAGIAAHDPADELAELMRRVCWKPGEYDTVGTLRIWGGSSKNAYRQIALNTNSVGLDNLRTWIIERTWEKKPAVPAAPAVVTTTVSTPPPPDAEYYFVESEPEGEPEPVVPVIPAIDPATVYEKWGDWQ